MDKRLKTNLIFIIVLLLGIAYKYTNVEQLTPISDNKETKKSFSNLVSSQNPTFIQTTTADILAGKGAFIQLQVNPIEKFSSKSRKEIFAIRNHYVDESLFKPRGYNASTGTALKEIVDKKPWMDIGFYGRSKPVPTQGLSARSKFVVNPNLLVAMMESGGRYNALDGEPLKYFIPTRLYYEKKSNTVVAYYPFSEFVYRYFIKQNGSLQHTNFQLTGLNARDLGYEYGYANEIHNIKFMELDNISNQITQFRDFIHLGTSCGVDGGCNNISPYQPNLVFYVENFKYKATNPVDYTYIHIKLWKNHPANKNAPSDANMIIIIK